MDINFLDERNKSLQAELARAKQNIRDYTEKLEEAKNIFNIVTGHANEVSYLLIEAQRLKKEEEKTIKVKKSNN